VKKVLILSLALVLLLGVAANGTFGLFSDAETSTGNTFTAWVEECPPGSMVIVSDTATMVTEVNNDPITPQNAVYAWEPDAWDDVSDFFAGFEEPEADWIWETWRTAGPGFCDAPRTGRVVRFERTFSIPCSPVGAELYITVDNGYTVWINEHLVGCAQVDADGPGPCSDGDPCACIGWETSNLHEEYVHTHDWSTVEHYTIDSTDLETGENVLVILAANEHMSGGTADTNPAGLIYWLEVEWGG